MPGYDGGCTALGHLLGSTGIVWIRDNLRPESEVLGPEIDGWPETEISLGERNEGGQGGNGISRKMVGLDAEFLEELLRKVANRETESVLKVRYEDYELTGLEVRRELVAWQPACHPFRDPPRSAKPVEFVLSDVRALPGGPGRPLCHLLVAMLGNNDLLGRH